MGPPDLEKARQELDEAMTAAPVTADMFDRFSTEEQNPDSVKRLLGRIQSRLVRYAHIHQLPFIRQQSSRLFPNAAMELESKYDAVVGIPGSGTTLANYMHPLRPTGYLEWHKAYNLDEREEEEMLERWKNGPEWQDSTPPLVLKPGMRVLLTENDALSGITLETIRKKLSEYEPSAVDVCFTWMRAERSKAIGRALGFHNVFHITDVPQQRVFTTMMAYEKRLKQTLGDE